MQVTESIKKARERNIGDEKILEEIRRQNPNKEEFFKKAEERGASATQILDEIIKQNPPPEKKKIPISSEKEKTSFTPPPPPPASFKKEGGPTPSSSLLNKKIKGEEEGKTVLTKEAQEKEEEMRKQFLKRIEAKERGESSEEEGLFSSGTGYSSGNNTESIEETSKEMTDGFEEKSTPNFPKVVIIIVGVLFLGAAILLFFVFF